MSACSSFSASVAAVETLILDKFRKEPFHNLQLLYGKRLDRPSQGGTCSDKTLSFVAAARQRGFDVSLHSALIGGRDIHRLARVQVGSDIFFADVGSGWPALRLYPARQGIVYRSFGMEFRTVVSDHRVSVFLNRNGRESCQMEIDTRRKEESEIRSMIAQRFSSGIVYPFSNSLRFSQIVGDKFLFLRGDRLEVYGDHGVEFIEGITADLVRPTLLRYFYYDMESLLPA